MKRAAAGILAAAVALAAAATALLTAWGRLLHTDILPGLGDPDETTEAAA